MKHIKKFLPCILACAMVITPLAACSNNGRSDDKFKSDVEWTEGNEPDDSSIPDVPNIDTSTPDTPNSPTSPDENGGNGTGDNDPHPPSNTPSGDDEVDAPNTRSVSYIFTKVNALNIRSGPSTSYSSLGVVESGVLLKLDGKVGDFYRTTYLNRAAYVSANASHTSIVTFELDETNDDIERVIDEGLKVLGTKYVFGAVRYHYGNGTLIPNFTVTAFDCSSLMQYIFYQGANKLLDMTSRLQSLQGTEVDRSELQRGDLMFFTNASRKNNTGIERIGHVALYLGDNYILHTASDYAKVEQISTTRWSYYITARRLLD